MKYIISGGKKLEGLVSVQSAKNSVLALLAASLMIEGCVTLENCPKITDVDKMLMILEGLGATAKLDAGNITLDMQSVHSHEINATHAKEIRASIFLLGALLSRFRRAVVPYPGGCNIGSRPIDLHLTGLKAMGVKIEEADGYIICDGKNMKGGDVHFSYPSVGATENIMMAATLTNGTTRIYGAAKEPEIVDLVNFLNSLGGKVSGAGSDTIIIEGVKKLTSGASFLPIPDRIAAGTYLLAGLITGGELEINTNPIHIQDLITKLDDNACKIVCFSDKIIAKAIGRTKSIPKIVTKPYPHFPTDLQAQIMALLSVADGTSEITETLFETRFRHAEELNKMGANITTSGNTATICGVKKLVGADITAFDLRGGAAMVLAGLVAEGQTTINDIRHIDRGYQDFEDVLSSLGADIKRV